MPIKDKHQVLQYYIQQQLQLKFRQLMQNCFSKFTDAPIQYINELRSLKANSISMKGTTFYPAFPLALFSSLLCICGLSTYMIYYFFSVDQNVCFEHIGIGVIVLAIIYPIQSIIIYICLFGSVVLSQTRCWKVFTMIFFGLLATGFSFGGLGFVFLCTISVQHPLLIPATFLSSNVFIQTIVYSYLSFFFLYIVILPLLTLSYNNRAKNTSPETTFMDSFCCVVFYSTQLLFIFTAIFMICIKILGPLLLLYVLVEVARSDMASSIGNLTVFFTFCILSLFLPMITFIITYLISNVLCKQEKRQSGSRRNTEKASQDKQTELSQSKTRKNSFDSSPRQKKKSVFLPPESIPNTIVDDSSGIKNDML